MIRSCIFLLSISLLLGSCGTTQLVTNNANVEIYVNNNFKGKGQATVTRTGPPQKMHVEARYQGERVGEINVKRKFEVITLIAGCYSYGLGWFITWRYPATVIIPTTNETDENKSSEPHLNVWELPPGEWKRSDKW